MSFEQRSDELPVFEKGHWLLWKEQIVGARVEGGSPVKKAME